MIIPLTADATLHPLVLPARADAGDADEFREFAAVRNEVYRQVTGRSDEDRTPAELLPSLRSDVDETRLQWSVRQGGAIVGRAMLDLPQESGSRVAFAVIELLPRVWGQGIGSAALPHLEAIATGAGRTILQSWAEQPASDGSRLPAPTGFGSVPHDHIARFALRHGFTLEQVDRVSILQLDDDARTRITRLRDDAARAATDYRVVRWVLPTPPERVAGYAWMKSRMSTDAPMAGLVIDEETWDSDRIARHDRRHLDAGRTMQVTAAEHIRTGELCAYNELVIGTDPAAATEQNDTLVLSEHRGHRLGMLVKCAGLLAWPEVAPLSSRVITWNAEENRPMLSINEAIGFTPTAYEGAWKKELS
ncbi:MAG: GNAT family N-acetyltransferase [Actinomycetota bacterium]